MNHPYIHAYSTYTIIVTPCETRYVLYYTYHYIVNCHKLWRSNLVSKESTPASLVTPDTSSASDGVASDNWRISWRNLQTWVSHVPPPPHCAPEEHHNRKYCICLRPNHFLVSFSLVTQWCYPGWGWDTMAACVNSGGHGLRQYVHLFTIHIHVCMVYITIVASSRMWSL